MAKQPKSAAPSLDGEAMYKVELTRSVPIGRHMVHPGPNVRLRGDVLGVVLEKAPEAVASHAVVE